MLRIYPMMIRIILHLAGFLGAFWLPLAGAPLNVLLFTADDLGYELMDPARKPDLDLTPRLDRFASQGMQFRHAHVNAAICQPSRMVMASGRYSHRSGAMGFIHLKESVPTMLDSFRKHGYLTGIIGKVKHSTPVIGYRWDYSVSDGGLGPSRVASKYYHYTKQVLDLSKQRQQAFYLMVNSHDPHRPFHNPDQPLKGAGRPSKLFSPEQVNVPDYLADSEETRRELSWYYNSVRRLDDTFGEVMKALDDSGLADSTLVVFLSDNGSAVPFAKANCYLASTRTPCLVRWPGVTEAGRVDSRHFISTVDLFPTLMEAVKLPAPDGVDGRSLVGLLKGEKQAGREYVFTQIDYKNGGPATPMRCVQDKTHLYIFNPWSRAGAQYRNANEGLSMRGMERLAESDPEFAERVRMFRDREVEECYRLTDDPGCLRNLIKDPESAAKIKSMQGRLRRWMESTKDPVLPMFDCRHDPVELGKALKRFPSKQSLRPR